MKAGLKQRVLLAALLTGSLLHGSQMALAEELPGFDLDKYVITAMRYEKKEIDVPAATVVITNEQIKAQGATTAAAALEKLNGYTAKSFGPLNASMGTMINEATLRGNDNGTLVMVNGKPISWRGKYNLDAIPADSIERIEVVKGGGAVLYGSEAMAGVINIITKKGANNSVTAGYGNYGQQMYNVNVGTDKLGVNYSLQKFPHQVRVGESAINYTKFKGSTETVTKDVKKENIGINYSINDNLDIMYNYYETAGNYLRYVNSVTATTSGVAVGDQFNGRLYTTKQHVAQVNYHDDLWKAGAFFNTGNIESIGPTKISSKGDKTPTAWYNTKEKNRTYGADVQRNWQIGDKAKAIMGVSFMDERYQALKAHSTPTGKDYSRDVWGIYGQWEQQVTAADTAVLSLRETFTRNAPGQQNYNNFSYAGQYLHKINDENSVYGSIGRTFIMPTFAQMYGASDLAIPNPGLKPQTGMNYEIGWKNITKTHAWKTAIFYTTITDNISANWDKNKSEYTYSNEDYRNYGAEFTCDIAGSGPWSYNYGLTVQDPKVKSEKKGYWDRKFGRVQLSGGVGYTKDKWSTNLLASYVAARVATPSQAESYDMKPYLLTTFNTIYRPDKNSDITLTIDNLLNREDNMSHSGSNYYTTPCNFLVSYSYRF